MARTKPTLASLMVLCPLFLAGLVLADEPAARLGQVLDQENAEAGLSAKAAPTIDDGAFLRRVYVDLIGRIPTVEELDAFAAMPAATRRQDLVNSLLDDPRFADTWTTFFADMLRLRSNASGGAAAIAFVHQSISDDMPYDEMARRFISANGKAGATPEVGFVLGDNADPMALAGATSQVFLGIRIACAQCHDHPFDVWTQEDFYGLAAYFGKTRRVETQFTNTVYTTEVAQSTVLWPPEGEEGDEERKPMAPTFPFTIAKSTAGDFLQRLTQLRTEKIELAGVNSKPAKPSVDDLLADLDDKVERASRGGKAPTLDVAAEAKRDAKNLKINSSMASESELRRELAKLITDPKNLYFSRSFVNRVWDRLIGRGFVNPVDDFSDNNPPSHPKTLDYLAKEFVATGYDLKTLVRIIVNSEPYQRGHASFDLAEGEQAKLEEAFLATPMRRMTSEVLYDSIVTAGHIFEPKHAAGMNLKTIWRQTRVAKEGSEEKVVEQVIADSGKAMKAPMKQAMKRPGYNLENAIELNFAKLLAQKGNGGEEVAIEKMAVMSKEELEAMRMEQQARQERTVEFIDRFIKSTIDDNPSFTSSFRMASPAPAEHFLRVFGQPDRTQLGQHRDGSPSMRQALMLLNGRLTHEASRVGESEPMHALLAGESKNLDKAVELAYREILTRKPTTAEKDEAKAIIGEANDAFAGVADLRWLLLNCDEFRFLP